MGDGKWTTHPWVQEEITVAANFGKQLILEVRESGVSNLGGMVANRQHLPYDDTKRAEFLVRLAEFVSTWLKQSRQRVQLGPQDFVDSLRGRIGSAQLECLWMDADYMDEKQVKADLRPIKGGLFVHTDRIPRNALIKVRVRHGTETWESDYQSFESVKIDLNKQV